MEFKVTLLNETMRIIRIHLVYIGNISYIIKNGMISWNIK